jgi:hypothetical protein
LRRARGRGRRLRCLRRGGLSGRLARSGRGLFRGTAEIWRHPGRRWRDGRRHARGRRGSVGGSSRPRCHRGRSCVRGGNSGRRVGTGLVGGRGWSSQNSGWDACIRRLRCDRFSSGQEDSETHRQVCAISEHCRSFVQVGRCVPARYRCGWCP